MELTKADKKAAREIIENGLQIELKQGLMKAASIIRDWEIKGGDNREYYHKLYAMITKSDEHIARRYDGMTSSKYLFIIAGQLNDGVISNDDLTSLSEDVQQAIEFIRR